MKVKETRYTQVMLTQPFHNRCWFSKLRTENKSGGGKPPLDRINVARLVIHPRSPLNKLARSMCLNPNDKTTRDEPMSQAESLMLELVGNRAIYDFLVVCDETNNTPARIDRNELYLDIAIEQSKQWSSFYIH